MQSNSFFSRHASGVIQTFIWGILFSAPMLLVVGEALSLRDLLLLWVLPLALLALLFYLTYLVYVPRLLFKERKGAFFLATSTTVLLLVGFSVVYLLQDVKTLDRNTLIVVFALALFQIVSYSMFVFAAFALRAMQRNQKLERERIIQQEELACMETENLKSRLNPHFIFNTLNNISALVAISPETALEAISRLSQLMRHVLEQGGVKFVPLNSEIDFVRDYISLMQLRYTSNLKVTTEFPERADAEKITVPPMLFISLVENAFKHGASSGVSSSIDIKLVIFGSSLTLDVTNTLLPQKMRAKVPSHGVGLANLRRRLEIIYPGQFAFSHGEKEFESIYSATLTIPCNHSL